MDSNHDSLLSTIGCSNGWLGSFTICSDTNVSFRRICLHGFSTTSMVSNHDSLLSTIGCNKGSAGSFTICSKTNVSFRKICLHGFSTTSMDSNHNSLLSTIGCNKGWLGSFTKDCETNTTFRKICLYDSSFVYANAANSISGSISIGMDRNFVFKTLDTDWTLLFNLVNTLNNAFFARLSKTNDSSALNKSRNA